MALETPSRPPPFMANAILTFHFDFLKPSLSRRKRPSDMEYETMKLCNYEITSISNSTDIFFRHFYVEKKTYILGMGYHISDFDISSLKSKSNNGMSATTLFNLFRKLKEKRCSQQLSKWTNWSWRSKIGFTFLRTARASWGVRWGDQPGVNACARQRGNTARFSSLQFIMPQQESWD